MVDLQIPEDFCHNDVKPKGQTNHSDGENFHYIWGDGRTDGAAFSNDDVKAAYAERGEEQVPLGIHGTTVAVDWDSCVAAGSCMSVCPVQTFQWYRTEKDRLDYTDKSQPIREHDCTVCMACQEICPEGAIRIESANQEWHEKAAGTYVIMKSGSENPHAHD
jgi:NAD-dependent dihydropyrimidine dehydrogenase PreA subunit